MVEFGKNQRYKLQSNSEGLFAFDKMVDCVYMAYIFLDESGDLGFDFKKHKTSKYFVITFLFVKEKNHLEKIIKKVFKGFSKKEVKSHNGVLHAFKESPKVRQKVLSLFREKNISNVIVIYLNKKKVYTRLQDEKHVLYNYVTNILLDRVCTKKLIPIGEKIFLVASRRETNKFLNQNFSSYLENQAKNNHKIDIEIEIKSPTQEKSLQIVDMLSWSVFRKYEHGDDFYYNIFKQDITEENSLFG